MFPKLATQRIAASLIAGAALAAGLHAQTSVGVAGLANAAARSLAPALGAANGTWIQADLTKGLLYGELQDEKGVVLYGLQATTHAISAANGSIDGLLVERVASTASMKQIPLRVIGQYVVSDAESGVFRAFILLDIGVVGVPMLPVGVIEGTYARLHVQVANHPYAAAAAGQADPTLRNTHSGGPTKLPFQSEKLPTAGQAGGVKPWGPGGIFHRPIDRAGDIQVKPLVSALAIRDANTKKIGVFSAIWSLGK